MDLGLLGPEDFLGLFCLATTTESVADAMVRQLSESRLNWEILEERKVYVRYDSCGGRFI